MKARKGQEGQKAQKGQEEQKVKKGQNRQKKLRITEADYMLAQRRAARLEEIAEHGRPVSFRKALHRSKKAYDRKKLKKNIPED